MYATVNGARLWIEEAGDGPAILFLHGGLGDSRLWEPVASELAEAFRCVRYDLRFWGRSSGPGELFSPVEDAVGVLDALGIEQAALVGLSFGGTLALDVSLAHRDRVTALVHVAGGMTGVDVRAYTEEQRARADQMEVDFEVWAPLGADDLMRELWQSTPDARGVPDGADVPEQPAARPQELRVPALVIVATHDPPLQQEAGRELARRAPEARLVEVDSDHYLTLREPQLVAGLIREFLTA